MEIYKIIVIALTTAVLCAYLKSINSDLFMLALICGGVLILSLSLNYLIECFSLFNDLANRSGIDKNVFNLVIKITLVAYLIEFACGLIDDFGIKSLSDKVAFGGKLLLLAMSTPIIINLFEIVVGFLE